MKKYLVYALLFVTNYAVAQTVNLTASDVNIPAGGTADLVLSLENSMEIAGWQLTLYLPEDITLPYEEEDGEKYYDETIKLSSRHLRSHVCTVTETSDGGWLIMAYNPNKPTAIKENSGELVTITLKAADTFDGTNMGTIKNVSVADMQSVQTDMEGTLSFAIVNSPSDGILEVQRDKSNHLKYDVGGRPVNTSERGIYIQDGRKYVKLKDR